jgi:hypothetical protein
MIYLLDVNAPAALGFVNHEFHDRVVSWICAQKLADVGYLPDYGVGICACWREPRRTDSRSLRRTPC